MLITVQLYGKKSRQGDNKTNKVIHLFKKYCYYMFITIHVYREKEQSVNKKSEILICLINIVITCLLL